MLLLPRRPRTPRAPRGCISPTAGAVRLAGRLCAPILLTACCALVGCTAQTQAVAQNARALLPAAQLHPQLRADRIYLRVYSQGRVSYLVRGSIETAQGASIETWYSASGEVLRLQGGRVVGTAGLSTDWRAVRLRGVPDWERASVQPVSFLRERDQMPGYRFGLREELTLRAISPVADSMLQDIDPGQLQWFEEASHPITPGAPALSPSRFALGGHGPDAVVVYGEQCLAPGLCLAWQRWPARTAAPRS